MVLIGSWIVGCASVDGPPEQETPELAPRPAEIPDDRPTGYTIPEHLAPFLPIGLDPAEVADPGVDAAVVRYRASRSAMLAAWPPSLERLSETERLMLGAAWDGSSRSFVLIGIELEEGGFALRELSAIPEVGLPACHEIVNNEIVRGVALEAAWTGQRVWSDGERIVGCVPVAGPLAPIGGRFRIRNAQATVLSGGLDPTGRRSGDWVLREPERGRRASSGSFADDRPVGEWMFGEGLGEEGSFPADFDGSDPSDRARTRAEWYDLAGGQAADAPLAYLPATATDSDPYEASSFSVADADLTGGLWRGERTGYGWIDAVVSYRSAKVRAPEGCPDGERWLVLRPDRRVPIQDRIVGAPDREGPCGSAEQLAAARESALALFAENRHPRDYQRIPTPPPESAIPAVLVGRPARLPLRQDASISVEVPPQPLWSDGERHELSWTVREGEPTLGEELSEPDLVGGSWVSDAEGRMFRIEVRLDRAPSETLWVRWPTRCPDAVWLQGLLAQGRLVSPVYRIDPCDGAPRWVVGETLALSSAVARGGPGSDPGAR